MFIKLLTTYNALHHEHPQRFLAVLENPGESKTRGAPPRTPRHPLHPHLLLPFDSALCKRVTGTKHFPGTATAQFQNGGLDLKVETKNNPLMTTVRIFLKNTTISNKKKKMGEYFFRLKLKVY